MPLNEQSVFVDAVEPRMHATFSPWNRVEVRPRSTNFDRSLRAEVRDPLWMLCRQWQWGEFKGEDTGSPVFAKFHNVTRKMTRLALGDDAATVYDATFDDIPLEARVEHLPIILDTHLGLKIGRRWKKLLSSASMQSYHDDYLDLYAFDVPIKDADAADYYSSNNPEQHHIAAAGRTMDGRQLITYLNQSGNQASDSIATTGGDDVILNGLGETLMTWFNELYYEPLSEDNPAWNRSRMEYSFSASIPQEAPGGGVPVDPTVLVAKEYYNGHISWDSMDIASSNTSVDSSLTDPSTPLETDTLSEQKTTMIPVGIKFPGMPADRWWELESHEVSFGDLKANSTDVAKIMLTEFGLVYAHEWNVVPFTVPVGSMSEIQSIVVTDTFGQKVLVEPAGKGQEQSWQRWNMFNLNTADAGDGSMADLRLFIPPSTPKIQESEPIEQVNFFRDEMSNMVWGIESTISDDLGGSRDGTLAATEKTKYFESLADSEIYGQLIDNSNPIENVNLSYKLNSTAPENWIPFIPVRPNQSIINATFREIQLKRGTMPRYINRLNLPTSQKYIRPRTFLLSPPASNPTEPLFLFEEEVPRSGVHLEYTYQRTRWFDGKIVLWAGVRKLNGGGEGASGLLFDRLSGSFRNY